VAIKFILILSLLTSCTKTKYITRTETIEVFVPQYRDFDPATITRQTAPITDNMTWAEGIILLSEQIQVCESNIDLILNTIND